MALPAGAATATITVGVSTDIIDASWIALVDSIEYKLLKLEEAKAKSKADAVLAS